MTLNIEWSGSRGKQLLPLKENYAKIEIKKGGIKS